MAFPGRFERPACRLGGGRSILLSYGNIYSLFSIMPHSRDSAFAHLGGGRSILLSYRCLPLPLHYSRRARGLSRKRTGMRARREKAGARENECGTGVENAPDRGATPPRGRRSCAAGKRKRCPARGRGRRRCFLKFPANA